MSGNNTIKCVIKIRKKKNLKRKGDILGGALRGYEESKSGHN